MKKNLSLLSLLLLINFCSFGQTVSYSWHATDDNTNTTPNMVRVLGDTLYAVHQFYKDSIDANPYSPKTWIINPNAAGSSSFQTTYLSKFLRDGTYINTVRLMESVNLVVVLDFEIDKAHNLVLMGNANTGVDFDPSATVIGLPSGTSRGDFVAIYSPNGVYKSHFLFPRIGLNEFYITTGEIDASNNLYVGGELFGSYDLDPSAGSDMHTSTGNSDAAIVKIDLNSNTYKWGKHFGGSVYDGVEKVATNNNLIAISGIMNSTSIDFDPNAGVSTKTKTASNEWSYISILDKDGNYYNSTIFGGKQDDIFSTDIAIDKDSSVFCLSKYFVENDTIDLDYSSSKFLVHTGYGTEGGIFLSKFDKDLNPIWAKTMASEYSVGNVVDDYSNMSLGKNHIILAGWYSNGNLNFGDNTKDSNIASASAGENATFIASMDKKNGALYSITSYKSYDTANSFFYNVDLQLDSLDNIYSLGSFRNKIDFNPIGPVSKVDSSISTTLINTYLLRINYTQKPSEINEQLPTASQIKLYPNPTENIANIESKEIIASIDIRDITGRLVERLMPNTTSYSINLSSKASGLYLIKITTNSGNMEIRKLIKN